MGDAHLGQQRRQPRLPLRLLHALVDTQPTTDGGAYISASNDGSNWVTAAKWTTHPGSENRAWLTAAQSSSYKYSTVIADMDAYGIRLVGSAGVKYKYWRAGGHKWMNQNMLPCNVILRCYV